jgi:2-dehydro-3-deoxyphosphogluconate aldolase/(4S)-4-hydroxy-2-oxoglutarate aldolase
LDETLEVIHRHGVVPVVVIEAADAAPALVAALMEGGLPVAEFTFRTAAAADAIHAAVAAHPEALIGAGSVLDPAQVDTAVDAGARFIVSAGLASDVVRQAMARGVTALPGCATASDLMQARRLGLDCVKFFPAEALGGLRMLRAVAAPFPGLRFVPTGGIEPANLADYVADPRVLAVGGSWMVQPDIVRAADWSAITRLALAAVTTVRQVRGET